MRRVWRPVLKVFPKLSNDTLTRCVALTPSLMPCSLHNSFDLVSTTI